MKSKKSDINYFVDKKRTSLTFDPSVEQQKIAYDFLQIVSKKQTQLVSKLITDFLKQSNIYDLNAVNKNKLTSIVNAYLDDIIIPVSENKISPQPDAVNDLLQLLASALKKTSVLDDPNHEISNTNNVTLSVKSKADEEPETHDEHIAEQKPVVQNTNSDTDEEDEDNDLGLDEESMHNLITGLDNYFN